ncbi:MAG: sulfite exporter TauE/SafE family protein [Polyangiaceae bacterium]|nr:sulfite exporter TauE/SafE family protein [Polyangiaceae bacterium]
MQFVPVETVNVVGLIALGLVGGMLGGFVGGGGAFVMVPGLMGLGVDGLTAVGSNLLHRLGRMATSKRRWNALRRVDPKLLVLLSLPSVAGVELGRGVTALLRERYGRAVADMHVSGVLIVVLGAVTHMLLMDLWRSRRHAPIARPLSVKGVMRRLRPLRMPPVIRFPASNVVVSLWLVLAIGFVAGWFGGTIALGGFLTVPALIYLLGMPASIAIAADLSLVLVIGAYGAVTFAVRGHVNLHATLLLYLGSIPGFHLGMVGARLMRETPIRIASCFVLGLVGFGRLLALPMLSADAGWSTLPPGVRTVLHVASLVALFGAAALVVALVGGVVARALWTRSAHALGHDMSGEED